MARGREPTVPTSVLMLCALGGISLSGFAACAVGFAPVPRPLFIEALAPQPWLATGFVVAGAAGLFTGLLKGLRKGLRGGLSLSVSWPACRRQELYLATLIVITMAILSLWTLLPPFLIDEALYHLTFPVQYLLHGGFVVVEGHGNSSFPAFTEMIGFWPLACGSISGARAIQLLVLAMGLPAMLALLPELPARATLWGSVLMVFTPVVFCILPTSHIDLAQSVFALVALLCLARYHATGSISLLYAAGWLAGCAAACKYLALALIPFAVLAFLFILRAWQQQEVRGPTLGQCLLALVLLLFPVAPWLLRNAFIWHNPLYPFATSLFGSTANALAVQQINTLDFFLRQFGPADGMTQLFGWQALWRLPIDLFFRARFERLQFDGVIGPLFYAVVLAWLLGRRWRAPYKLPPMITWYAVFFVAVWLSTSWQMRFIISPYWAVVLWAPLLWDRIQWRPWRLLVAALFAGSLLWVSPSIAKRMPKLSWQMFGDQHSAHALRLERQPDTVVCDALNAAAYDRPGTSTKAMLVWTQRIALWCATDLLSESYDEATSFNAWMLADTVQGTLAFFSAHNVTHVVIDEDSFFAMPPSGVGEREGQELSQVFSRYNVLRQTYLKELSRHGPVVLYALLAMEKHRDLP